MTEVQTVLRIAARGDGVLPDGRYVTGAAPGDTVLADGTIVPGPHHVPPPCMHFGRCGGCQLQQLDDSAMSDFVRDRVLQAARSQRLEFERVAPVHLSPPRSRRRATLHAVNGGGRPVIGFREGASHQTVDLRECHVLAPELFAVVEPLRRLLARRPGRYALDIALTLADQGVDMAIKGLTIEGLRETEGLLDFAKDNGLARLTLDQGYGPETMWEPDPISICLSGVSVSLPAGAFLQATADGEQALVSAARAWLAEARFVADLFSGLGTFAFALAGPATKVLAAEAAQDAHIACKAAAGRSGRPVHPLHRDLFRNPLQVPELDRFDAILLDPPRAGAREQVGLLAQSKVLQIAYVSCNPSSWARDARTLADGGYKLVELRPVGQFRWSTHVELASLFMR